MEHQQPEPDNKATDSASTQLAPNRRSPIGWLMFIATRLIRLCVSLLLRILLFFLIAVGIILFTQSGREWLIVELLPELLQDKPLQIEVEDFASPDPGHWQFARISVNVDNEPVFTARELLLKFDFPKLLVAQVDILELSARRIDIHLSASSQNDDTPAFAFEQLQDYLVPIQLRKLALDHLEFSPTKPTIPPLKISGHAQLLGPDTFLASNLNIQLHNASETALHLLADLDASLDGRLQLKVEEQAGGWLGKLINLPVKQPIKIEADLLSQRKDQVLEVDLRTLRGPWAEFIVNIQGQAQWHSRSKRLNLPQLSIQIGQHQQYLSGWWQEQAFDIEAQLNDLPLAIAAPFQDLLKTGSVSGEFTAKGSTSAPEFMGAIQLATNYAGHPLALDMQADGDLQTLSITDTELILGEAKLKTSGTVSIAEQTFDLAVHALTGPLSIITVFDVPLPEGLSVDIHQTQGRVYGPFTAPLYEGKTKASVIYNEQKVSAESGFKGDIHKVELKSFHASLHRGQLKAEGNIDWSNELQNLTLDAQNIPLTLLSLTGLELPPELSADVSSQGKLSGSFTQPYFKGVASAEGRYAQSQFSIQTNLDSSASQVQLKDLNATIALDAQPSPDKKSSEHATLTIPRLAYQLDTNRLVTDISASKVPYRIAELLSINLPQSLTGSIDAELNIDGSLPLPAIKGHLTSAGEFEGEQFKLAFSGIYDDARLQFDQARFDWRDTKLSLHGTVSEQELGLKAQLEQLNLADLAKFGLAAPNGILNLQLSLNGTRQKTELEGQIQLETVIPGLLEVANGADKTLLIQTQLKTEQEKLLTRTRFKQGAHEQGWLNINSSFIPLLEKLLNSENSVKFAEIPLAVETKGEIKLAWLNLFITQHIHRFDGILRLDTKLSGTPDKPVFNGSINIQEARYQNVYSQSALEDTRLNISIKDNYVEIQQGHARVAAGGELNLSGHINLAAKDKNQVNLSLSLVNAALVNREDVMGKASGELKLSGNMQDIMVAGLIKINPFQLMVEKIALDSIPEIKVSSKKNQAETSQNSLALPLIHLDILVELDQQAYIRGRGIDAELGGKIEISGNTTAIQTKGRFQTIRGQFEVFNKVFKLETGNILFADEHVQLNIQGRYKAKEMDFIASLTGTLEKPEINLRTVPALPEDEALARLLFGRSISNISAIQAIQLAAALQTLRGENGGFDPLGEARKLLNVDRLNIESQESSEGKGVSIGVGKYLTDKIYIEATRTPEPAQPWKGTVEVELSPRINLETTTGGSSGFGGVELQWKKDY